MKTDTQRTAMEGQALLAPYRIYSVPLRRILGSAEASAFLLQLQFWMRHSKAPGNWVYKTGEEWEAELGCSRKEQFLIRAKLKKLGLLEEKTEKWNRGTLLNRIYFRTDSKKVDALIEADLKQQKEPSEPEEVLEAAPHDVPDPTAHQNRMVCQAARHGVPNSPPWCARRHNHIGIHPEEYIQRIQMELELDLGPKNYIRKMPEPRLIPRRVSSNSRQRAGQVTLTRSRRRSGICCGKRRSSPKHISSSCSGSYSRRSSCTGPVHCTDQTPEPNCMPRCTSTS